MAERLFAEISTPSLMIRSTYRVAFKTLVNVVDADTNFHLIYEGDCAIDQYGGPHLLEVSLVRETGVQALVGEYYVYTEPKLSATESITQSITFTMGRNYSWWVGLASFNQGKSLVHTYVR